MARSISSSSISSTLHKYIPSDRTIDIFSRTITGITITYITYKIGKVIYFQGVRGLIKTITGNILTTVRSIPLLSQAIDKGLDEALSELIEEIAPVTTSPKMILPSGIMNSPNEQNEVEVLLRDAQLAMEKDAHDNGFQNSSVFGGIYHPVSYNSHILSPSSSSSSYPLIQYLQSTITSIFLNTNQLYPTLFRYARKMEAEAVMMGVNLLKGYGLSSSTVDHANQANDVAPDAVGVLTSGGTESIVVSVKTYRDAALAKLGYTDDIQEENITIHGSSVSKLVSPITQANKDGIYFQVLAGITCHPALDKACHLLGLQLIKIPVNPITKALDPQDIKRFLTPYTLVIYASAPGFAHGIVDPVKEIGDICVNYHSTVCWGTEGVPIHVDNCLGGILLSFAYNLQQQPTESSTNTLMNKYPIPAFDFRAHTAVKTISMDIHKYGNVPKGSSIVAFRTSNLRKYAYTAVTDFPGGFYTTPTIGGSRNGIAGALSWSTLIYYGYTGYGSIAKITMEIYQYIIEFIESKIPELQLVGTPHACIIAFTSAKHTETKQEIFSSYSLAARMEEKGWHLALLQNPSALHIVITERLNELYIPKESTTSTKASLSSSIRIVDRWLQDLEECTKLCVQDPYNKQYLGKGTAAIYGAASILPGGEVKRILQRYCDILYMVR